MTRLLTASALLMMLSPLAFARPPQGEDAGDEKRRPPREAVEACEGLQMHETCSFTGREGEELPGTCFRPDDAPEDAPLACRPEGAPEGPPRR